MLPPQLQRRAPLEHVLRAGCPAGFPSDRIAVLLPGSAPPELVRFFDLVDLGKLGDGDARPSKSASGAPVSRGPTKDVRAQLCT
eukprot:3128106-Pyramimonas_sp.AAC.1